MFFTKKQHQDKSASLEPKLPAVILAAGRGTRLGDLTRDIPKALLEVGGMTLLARQIATIRECDEIGDILIVTGFARETVEPYLNEHVLECHNGAWAQGNNIVSLHAAIESDALDNGFYLFNSDVVFHPDILKKLVHNSHFNELVVDNTQPADDEQMKVLVDPETGAFTDIAKTIALDASNGEYIGIAKFNVVGARLVRAAVARLVNDGQTSEWYEAAFRKAFDSLAMYPCFTGGKPWAEIDTPEDLEKARVIAEQLPTTL